MKARKNAQMPSWLTWRGSTSRRMRSFESTRPSWRRALTRTRRRSRRSRSARTRSRMRKWSSRKRRRRRQRSWPYTLTPCTRTSPRCSRRRWRRWKTASGGPTRPGRKNKIQSLLRSLKRSLIMDNSSNEREKWKFQKIITKQKPITSLNWLKFETKNK